MRRSSPTSSEAPQRAGCRYGETHGICAANRIPWRHPYLSWHAAACLAFTSRSPFQVVHLQFSADPMAHTAALTLGLKFQPRLLADQRLFFQRLRRQGIEVRFVFSTPDDVFNSNPQWLNAIAEETDQGRICLGHTRRRVYAHSLHRSDRFKIDCVDVSQEREAMSQALLNPVGTSTACALAS
jgi:hypothetical protein